MQLSDLSQLYQAHPGLAELSNVLKQEARHVRATGMHASVPALVCAALAGNLDRHQLVLLNDKEEAAYFYNDVASLLGDKRVLFFPASYKRSVKYGKTDQAQILERTETLDKTRGGDQHYIIATYPDALLEKVMSREGMEDNKLMVHKGEKLDMDFVRETLDTYGFEHVDFVYEPGQYAMRGSLIDVFSFSSDYPCRIDFYGSEIESLRSFDVETQLSRDHKEKQAIMPNIRDKNLQAERIAFLDYIPADTIMWVRDLKYAAEVMDNLFELAQGRQPDEEDGHRRGDFISGSSLLAGMEGFQTIEFGKHFYYDKETQVAFSTTHQPSFRKEFRMLAENLSEYHDRGYRSIILSKNPRQHERLCEIFTSLGSNVDFEALDDILHEGFIDHDIKLCCYTDHQLFNRYHKYKQRKSFTRNEALTIQEIAGLHPGDYVVHIDHGIGKFAGLARQEENGKVHEYLKLTYRGNDFILVSIHSLHRISKYKSSEGEAPTLHRLGSQAWQRTKQKTKKKIKDIAADLIKLYAKRKETRGHSFGADTYLQQELEASFFYEDTPDQEESTRAVKADMESSVPMDRLVCGDVGFGKTEVAIRAAFKALNDSKQVAVLAPTTVLVLQHFHTFRKRLEKFPCRVEYVSRMKSTAKIKESLKETKEGKVDILIGTHRILGKDVKFKDLGLLIIDEEQKFGVSAKEKLKNMRLNVDTLTLTATPIPRTLQFSLMGARDLSVIKTPPPNRQPIHTELHTFNEAIIGEAVNFEISRGGQVFFVHNRVQNLAEVEALVKKVSPDARTVMAHGQMDGGELERIMLDFIDHEYDVLVSTTIVESGLDIPNANTIIINQAHHFGLSDLHQLRGRVGRSNRKAFCYLLAPSLSHMTSEARRRLRAIEEFSDLGDGFNLALQDLDIRGGGNLLGGEQSGFIADIGFETYQRILDDALRELREKEYREQLPEENTETEAGGEEFLYASDSQIDTDLVQGFPEDYINSTTERLRLYRELNTIDNEEALVAFGKALEDRFGQLPEQASELMNVVRLRWRAIRLGIERVVLKKGVMIFNFITDKESSYFRSLTFAKILMYAQQNPKGCEMKDKGSRLSLSIKPVCSIGRAIEICDSILEA